MGQNQKGKGAARERVICFCYNVTETTILEAIRNGCQSLMDIRRETYASTGCAGCSEEVKKLLRKNAHLAVEEVEEEGQSGESDPGKRNHG